MLKIYGKTYKKIELLKRVGDISQIARIRRFELKEGKEKGVDVAQFHTGSGLIFDVLLGRGMDISFSSFRGIPLAWRSSTGDVSSEYFEPEGTGWLRSFHGGLLVTCGLTYLGAPCKDEGKELGLHGRISNIPAKEVSIENFWKNDKYIMTLKGKIIETSVFGENICLTRKITAVAGESKIFIEDNVENLGFKAVEHMILYHINVGFPVLDENARLHIKSKKVIYRDTKKEVKDKEYLILSSPDKNYTEKVYYHYLSAGKDFKTGAGIINESLNDNNGVGVYVKYDIRQLPYFVEWKMLGEGIYVLGMEPANCFVEGRDVERRENRLQYLKPGQKRRYIIEIGVLSSRAEIKNFRKFINNI